MPESDRSICWQVRVLTSACSARFWRFMPLNGDVRQAQRFTGFACFRLRARPKIRRNSNLALNRTAQPEDSDVEFLAEDAEAYRRCRSLIIVRCVIRRRRVSHNLYSLYSRTRSRLLAAPLSFDVQRTSTFVVDRRICPASSAVWAGMEGGSPRQVSRF